MHKWGGLASREDSYEYLIKEMNIILTSLGLSTTIVFLFRREFLTQRKEAFVFLLYTSILFTIGIGLDDNTNKYINFLKIPFPSLLIFYCLVFLFYIYYKRFPNDTSYSTSKKPVQDVIFNIVYWFLGIFIPVVTYL